MLTITDISEDEACVIRTLLEAVTGDHDHWCCQLARDIAGALKAQGVSVCHGIEMLRINPTEMGM